MTVVCVGCGLEVDSEGKLALSSAPLFVTDGALITPPDIPEFSGEKDETTFGSTGTVEITNLHDCRSMAYRLHLRMLGTIYVDGFGSVFWGVQRSFDLAPFDRVWTHSVASEDGFQEIQHVSLVGDWFTLAPGDTVSCRFRAVWGSSTGVIGARIEEVAVHADLTGHII